MSDVICEVDWDDCEHASVDIDGEEDVIYFDGKEGPDGWSRRLWRCFARWRCWFGR